jgi:hypothetical protein
MLNNIEIIFAKKNLDSISTISLFQNKSINLVFYYFINDDFFSKNYLFLLLWFYYFLGLFYRLNIILIDSGNYQYKIKKFFNNTKHIIYVLDNENYSNSYLSLYIDQYQHTMSNKQLQFYDKILTISNNLLNNIELSEDDNLLLNAINTFMYQYHYTPLLLWEFSFEGDNGIDTLINLS